MNPTERTLLKSPEEPPEDRALRLDDASDRVVVLAGRVIQQLQDDDRHVSPDDLDDLEDALEDVDDVLNELTEPAEL